MPHRLHAATLKSGQQRECLTFSIISSRLVERSRCLRTASDAYHRKPHQYLRRCAVGSITSSSASRFLSSLAFALASRDSCKPLWLCWNPAASSICSTPGTCIPQHGEQVRRRRAPHRRDEIPEQRGLTIEAGGEPTPEQQQSMSGSDCGLREASLVVLQRTLQYIFEHIYGFGEGAIAIVVYQLLQQDNARAGMCWIRPNRAIVATSSERVRCKVSHARR